MDEIKSDAAKMRCRCKTWPLKRFLAEEESLQQSEDSFHPFDCLTSEVSKQSPSHSQHSNVNFTLLPSHLCINEEEELDKPCRRNFETSRKINPWGEHSYADLITRAIESSPQTRLKLNDIYQWFIDNIPYFNERSSTDLASGWKVQYILL
jgi:hypothetical protein